MTVKYRVAKASAPKKVCYFGDYLDIFGGATVTAAISLRTSVEIEAVTGPSEPKVSPLEERILRAFGIDEAVAIRIHHIGPIGAGLGSSASKAVALTGAAAALAGRRLGRYEIATLAHQFENEVGWICGPQDHFAATYGGVNKFIYQGGRVSVDNIRSGEKPLVVYCGERRKGSQRFAEVRDRFTPEVLRELRRITEQGACALREGKLAALGRLASDFFHIQKDIGLTTPRLEKLMSIGISAGAYGGKVSGWGFGGCFVLWCEEGRKAEVEAALSRAGASSLAYEIDSKGLLVAKGKGAKEVRT